MRNGFNYAEVNAYTCFDEILTVTRNSGGKYRYPVAHKSVHFLKLIGDNVKRSALVGGVVLIKQPALGSDKHKLCRCRTCVNTEISAALVSADILIFEVAFLVAFNEFVVFFL